MNFKSACVKPRILDGDFGNPYLYGGIIGYRGTFWYLPGHESYNEWEPGDDAVNTTKQPVYRVAMSDITVAKLDWVNFDRVASCCGTDAQEYKSATLFDRARILSDVIAYYGPQEFDSYPDTYTHAELYAIFGIAPVPEGNV